MMGIEQIFQEIINKLSFTNGYKKAWLEKQWVELVGLEAGKHCRPVRVDREILFVVVDSSAWNQELFMRKAKLVEKINRKFTRKMIEDVKYQIGTFAILGEKGDLPESATPVKFGEQDQRRDDRIVIGSIPPRAAAVGTRMGCHDRPRIDQEIHRRLPELFLIEMRADEKRITDAILQRGSAEFDHIVGRGFRRTEATEVADSATHHSLMESRRITGRPNGEPGAIRRERRGEAFGFASLVADLIDGDFRTGGDVRVGPRREEHGTSESAGDGKAGS